MCGTLLCHSGCKHFRFDAKVVHPFLFAPQCTNIHKRKKMIKVGVFSNSRKCGIYLKIDAEIQFKKIFSFQLFKPRDAKHAVHKNYTKFIKLKLDRDKFCLSESFIFALNRLLRLSLSLMGRKFPHGTLGFQKGFLRKRE